jgi:hypothetical protein
MQTLLRSSVMTLLAALAACGAGDRDDTDTAAATGGATVDTSGGMGGTRDMGGMMGGKMMEDMQSHMRMMIGASADSMKTMLSIHRQMVANMISQMNREMKQMNMTGDASWTATMDSLRQDLVRMPEMSTAELKRFMPAHRARVMRLIEMHRKMMADMMK